MKSQKNKLNILALLIGGTALVQSVFAEYKEPNSYKYPKETITLGGDGRYSTDDLDDTEAFDNAIMDVHTAGGGHVIVEAGDYVAQGVTMKDNVHLLIDKDATIQTLSSGGTMFSGGTLNNASIRGSNGYFTCVLAGEADSGQKLYHGWSIENILIKNVDIVDDKPTTSQSIALSWMSENKTASGAKQYPNNVTVLNITKDSRSHYGYGLMQAQAARNTNFINMKGKGGVPVRLETGYNAMQINGRNTGGVHSIGVKNCVSTEAQSTVKINPHSMSNGDLYIATSSAVASVACVSFEAGSGHGQQVEDAGLGGVQGSFGKVTIKNTKSSYRPTGAPYKSGSFVNLPVDFVISNKNFYAIASGSKARSYDNYYIGPSANVINDSGTARDGKTITGVYRIVDGIYGSVPEFRSINSELSDIKAWMLKSIPVQSTPEGW